MTGRVEQSLTEMRKSKKGRKGKMPKKFSVKSGDKSDAGGLTAKGVKRYRAANPGSKLKTAVTTKPSKLKKGSKSAKRRKSFCARMGGMKKRLTSAKTRRDPDSRINKALRKWNCSTDIEKGARIALAERIIEACWKGYKAQGMKKKGNRMVPNCVKESFKELIEAVMNREPTTREIVRGKMRTQGVRRPVAVSQVVTDRDDARVRAAQGKNTISSTFGQSGTQKSDTAYGGNAGNAENRTPPMSSDQINRSGSSTARRATPRQTRAANMKLMKDMGALKFDDKGRRIRR
jgi:hypothetical protein